MDEKGNRIAFLAIVDKRVIGMVLVEKIDAAYQLLSPSSTGENRRGTSNDLTSTGLERSNVARRALLGIYQIWVHEKFRSRGIARSLVDAARSNMVFGYTIAIHEVAFSSPTELGVYFARRYTNARVYQDPPATNGLVSKELGTAQVLVYDCC